MALVAAFVTTTAPAGAAVRHRRAARAHAHHASAAKPGPPPLPCGTIYDFQVRLDRAIFSPGEIDGQLGDNLRRTVAAFQTTHNLEPNGNPECRTWAALGGDTAAPSTVAYQLTDDDLKGPFVEKIPDDLVAQAKLPALGYRTPLERIAERFHASPALLKRMNPASRFAAGETIQVPAVQPFDPEGTAKTAPDAPDVAIQVTRQDSALRVLGPNGELLFYAPVTSGSEHDPLPIATGR